MKIIKYVGSQAKLLTAVVLAAAVGGAATAVVSASIPDSSNVIHGCYSSKGALSVIDTATTTSCKSGSTELDWNGVGSSGGGSGGAAGYVYAVYDVNSGVTTIDSTRSSGVTSFTAVRTGTNSNSPELACLTFSSTPNTFTVTSIGQVESPSMADIKNQTGWLDNNTDESGGLDSPYDMLCDQNAPGSNAWLLPNGQNGTSLLTVF